MDEIFEFSNILSILLIVVPIIISITKKDNKNFKKNNEDKNVKTKYNNYKTKKNTYSYKKSKISNIVSNRIQDKKYQSSKNQYLDDEYEFEVIPQVKEVSNSQIDNYKKNEKLYDGIEYEDYDEITHYLNEENELLAQNSEFDFDIQKAVIYSEILQKPLSIR